MMDAKTMTLVERLKELEREERKAVDHYGTGNETGRHAAELASVYQQAITALEAAEKALEPFAREAEAWVALTPDDRLALADQHGDASPFDIRVGDLRLARSVYQKIKGEG